MEEAQKRSLETVMARALSIGTLARDILNGDEVLTHDELANFEADLERIELELGELGKSAQE